MTLKNPVSAIIHPGRKCVHVVKAILNMPLHCTCAEPLTVNGAINNHFQSIKDIATGKMAHLMYRFNADVLYFSTVKLGSSECHRKKQKQCLKRSTINIGGLPTHVQLQ